jgi:hypothetical protein
MIKKEYRSFVVRSGTEDAVAEYQQVFGYHLVSCSYALSGVKMIFSRDITSPLYPLWRREEKLHYHLLNDVNEIQKEINYVHRKAAFPSIVALIFWIIMLASLGVFLWMIFVEVGMAQPIEGSRYYFWVSLLSFATCLIIYVILVVSHRKKWRSLKAGLQKDQDTLAKMDHVFMNDLAKSNKVPDVAFDVLKRIEIKDKIGIYSDKD